jgi:hypothetical protein
MANVLTNGDLVRVRFWCTAGDQAAVNTMYWRVVAHLGTPVTDLDFAINFDEIMGSFYKAMMPSSVSYNGCEAGKVEVPALTMQIARGAAGAGTLGAIALPRQICSVVSFRTANSGRRYRGRVYLPFPPVGAAELDGTMTSAFAVLVAQWSAQWASINEVDAPFGSPTGSLTITQVIPHFLKKGEVGPELPPTDVVATSPGELFGTQRRRGSYGRQNTSPV